MSDGVNNIFRNDNSMAGVIADDAGELIQELILAKKANLDIKHIFGKVYPYPVASRVNKYTIRPWFERKLTNSTKKLFKFLY